MVFHFLSFLLDLFQYGELHFGHCFGFGFLSIQICPHRWHFTCDNGGMSLVSIIFNFSIGYVIFVSPISLYPYSCLYALLFTCSTFIQFVGVCVGLFCCCTFVQFIFVCFG